MKSLSQTLRASLMFMMLLTVLAAPEILPCSMRTVSAQEQRGVGLQPSEAIKQLPTSVKRFALIIGVDQYADTQITTLGGASNDAKALADALVRYAGFPQDQITLLASDQAAERQPTRGNILRRLSNMAAVVPKDGLLLVSFAGHGMEREGRAFLLPSDAQVSNDVYLLEQTAINVQQMREGIKRTGVGQVLLILDACRNDPVGRADAPNPLTPAYLRGFNFDVRNREVQAFATLYATAVGQRAYEYKEHRQGYFTWAMVEGLKGGAANEHGEVTLAGLVKYLQERVPKQVLLDLGQGKEQRPFAEVGGYKADELVIAVVGASSPTVFSTPTSQPTVSSSAINATSAVAEQAVKSGDQLVLENKLSEAEVEYKLAVRLDPTNAEWHNKLGFALHSNRKYAEAEAEYRAALRLAPNNAESHYGVGRALREQKKLVESESELREAIRIEPGNAKYHASLGNTLGHYQQRWTEAEAEMGQAIRLEPNNTEWHTDLSRILEEQKKYTEAEAEAREGVRLEPNRSRAHAELSLILLRQNKFAEGETEAREAIRLDPKNALAHGMLGYSLVEQKRDADAEAALREAVRLEPNEGWYHNVLGGVLQEQKKTAEAEAEYKEALRVDPALREKQEEEARQTKSFKGSWGIRSALGNFFSDVTLIISPDKIQLCDANGSCAAGSVVECSAFAAAVVDKSTIREIAMLDSKFRFNAQSPSEAVSALEEIRKVCKRP